MELSFGSPSLLSWLISSTCLRAQVSAAHAESETLKRVRYGLIDGYSSNTSDNNQCISRSSYAAPGLDKFSIPKPTQKCQKLFFDTTPSPKTLPHNREDPIDAGRTLDVTHVGPKLECARRVIFSEFDNLAPFLTEVSAHQTHRTHFT